MHVSAFYFAVQVLLRYNVQRGVPVIPRSQTEKNIQANISGLFEWNLTGAQKVNLVITLQMNLLDTDVVRELMSRNFAVIWYLLKPVYL